MAHPLPTIFLLIGRSLQFRPPTREGKCRKKVGTVLFFLVGNWHERISGHELLRGRVFFFHFVVERASVGFSLREARRDRLRLRDKRARAGGWYYFNAEMWGESRGQKGVILQF